MKTPIIIKGFRCAVWGREEKVYNENLLGLFYGMIL